MAEPTPQDLKDLWRLQRKAGGRDSLIRWSNEHPDPNLKPGRPSQDDVDVFLLHLAYDLGFAQNQKKRGYARAALRRAIRVVWESHEKSAQDKTLPDVVRAAYAKPLGVDQEAIMFRLLRKLRKRTKGD
jgi:hypothetical protein